MNRISGELFDAAGENNLPEARRLLSVGADIEAKSIYYGKTPLSEASMRGNVQVVKEFLDHGADVEAKDYTGWTPLHWACYYGRVTVGNELLSRGANIEAKTYQGETPLHCAYSHMAVVKALLSGGANILAANNNGHLPVHVAVEAGRSSAVAEYLLQQLYATTCLLPLHKLVEDLTWIGDPKSRDAPPLRYALHRNVLGMDDVLEILEYLAERNSEFLSSRDRDGSLPLHVACRRGAAFTIIQSLVDLYKASVKSVTPGGDLPLFLACEMPGTSLEAIFLLMKLYPDLVYR
jgi:ankyrin repeat protein